MKSARYVYPNGDRADLTQAQYDALVALDNRREESGHLVTYPVTVWPEMAGSAVLVSFAGMTLGVERDGYTHS